MNLSPSTRLREIEIPMLLMFVEEAFNLPVFQSGEREPIALDWTIEELAKNSNLSVEKSIETLAHLMKEFQDLEIEANQAKDDYKSRLQTRYKTEMGMGYL